MEHVVCDLSSTHSFSLSLSHLSRNVCVCAYFFIIIFCIAALASQFCFVVVFFFTYFSLCTMRCFLFQCCLCSLNVVLIVVVCVFFFNFQRLASSSERASKRVFLNACQLFLVFVHSDECCVCVQVCARASISFLFFFVTYHVNSFFI